jgi:uncharacterized protein YndB with AHSA1/START domain
LPADDRGSEPIAEREVVITRIFDAPARLLFKAYSTPGHLTQWFGPPGWTLTLCEMDFRVGGRLRLAMTGTDGKQGPSFGGEYLEVVPNRKIVYTGAFETPGAETMTVTISFDEDEKSGQTTLTVHTLFASVAMKNEHLGMGYAQGVASGLDQLADVVAAMREGTRVTTIVAACVRRTVRRKASGGELGHRVDPTDQMATSARRRRSCVAERRTLVTGDHSD